MVKRMLIDDTQPEETRVVIVNGNKIEDVEFESSSRKQIKSNIYLAKVMRVEPSLQAAFVDYGGNRHGFLAFGEIHPDYYNVSDEIVAEVEKEVDEIIEAKKQAIKEREAERERIREEKAQRRAERLKAEAEALAAAEAAAQEEAQPETTENALPESSEEPQTEAAEVKVSETAENISEPTTADNENTAKAAGTEQELAAETENEESSEESATENKEEKPARGRRRFRRRRPSAKSSEAPKVLAASTDNGEVISEEVDAESKENDFEEKEIISNNQDDELCPAADDDDEDEDSENDFELQKKLLKVRKLYHRSTIQDVIKEGQILLVQVVKEERGNKGAALTTYLSLAGRYCVLMPNRIKSGGVSRKITNVADRKRLKGIVKELPLTAEMSMIVRTAGEEKSKSDIVKDYNYLIRTWNNIRLAALKNKAPALIHEEGNLIKRALRDMFTKDISEAIVDGEEAFRTARDFIKMLAPQNLKKIKSTRKNDIPLFQRFQVEAQLDKLHDTNVQLESGGYLVINPTEALVSIDVNSGRATKEKDLEETALKTNLEAADEIARQLRMRNLAGLVVVDFIDMEDPKNNQAIEKRMKEAMKDDRARVQIAKMSCFGLLEISRQRMHSSFMESNYKVCPFCHGKGMIRTIESSCVLILRNIEEEGIKNRSSILNIFVPSDVAVYLLNQKRQAIVDLEKRYNMSVIISADNNMKNVEEFRIERTKAVKQPTKEEKVPAFSEVFDEEDFSSAEQIAETEKGEEATVNENSERNEREEGSSDGSANNRRRGKRERRGRFDRRDRRNKRERRSNNRESNDNNEDNSHEHHKDKQEAVILYSSHDDIKNENDTAADNKEGKKAAWWRKLIS